MIPPTPAQIRCKRRKHGLTQSQAAALVHVTLRTWQMWEAENVKSSVKIPLGTWELFTIKADKKKMKINKIIVDK